MSFRIIKALPPQKTVINNLMQFYMYDFSEFVDLDVQDNGLFAPYKKLDSYWYDENRFPYLIQKQDKYIGFALIELIKAEPREHFSVGEFFVMKKYRHAGIGKIVAHQIFNLHKGNWEIFQRESNKPAQMFWTKVIGEYTNGNFDEYFENGKRIQRFDNGNR